MAPTPRVLIVTSELFPEFGLPTAGGGVRASQLYATLNASGVDVALALHRETARDKKLPDWAVSYLYCQTNLAAVIEKSDADLVLGEGWEPLSHLYKDDRRIYVADCPGPLILEYQLSKQGSLRTNLFHKTRVLSRMDAVLCPNMPMRHYLSAYLAMAGWQAGDAGRIFQLPIGLPDAQPNRLEWNGGPMKIFTGGIAWAWHQSVEWLPDLADFLHREGIGEICLRSGQHPYHTLSETAYEPFNERISSHPAIRISDLCCWEELIADLANQALAIEWSPDHLEREIASTLRVATCLWAGVPMILKPGLAMASDIEAYQAGWLVSDWQELLNLIRWLHEHPEEVQARSQNARRLAADHHLIASANRDDLAGFLSRLEPRSKQPSFIQHGQETIEKLTDKAEEMEAICRALRDEVQMLRINLGHAQEVNSAKDAAIGDLHSRLHQADETTAAFHAQKGLLQARNAEVEQQQQVIERMQKDMEHLRDDLAFHVKLLRESHADAESYRALRKKLIYRLWKKILP